MKCSLCEELLTGGVDTYGPHEFPLCWSCYCEGNGRDWSYYGLAPHVHDLERTGSVIGSTVFTGEQDGRFIPDPEAPGLGFWSLRGPRGWQ